MPMFHFHLVTKSDRERIGTIDLPNEDAVIPAGLKLTVQILAGAARHKAESQGWTVQVTDNSGALVHNFKVSDGTKGDEEQAQYLH